jgi:hypothetical protein
VSFEASECLVPALLRGNARLRRVAGRGAAGNGVPTPERGNDFREDITSNKASISFPRRSVGMSSPASLRQTFPWRSRLPDGSRVHSGGNLPSASLSDYLAGDRRVSRLATPAAMMSPVPNITRLDGSGTVEKKKIALDETLAAMSSRISRPPRPPG